MGVPENATEGTCCSCHHEGTVYVFMGGGNPSAQKEHRHCWLCYTTEAGNACVYPTVTDHPGLVRVMAQIGNVILDELKSQRRG